MSYEDRFPMLSSLMLKGVLSKRARLEELGPICLAGRLLSGRLLSGSLLCRQACLATQSVGLKHYSLKAKLLSFLALSMVMSSQSISCFSGLPVEPVFKY